MAATLHRTVLAADLRGSTGLYEHLGNAAATALVTRCVAALDDVVRAWGGHVFKTLGDGLIATFSSSDDACTCAEHLHAALRRLDTHGPGSASPGEAAAAGLPGLRLKVALARGEVIAQDGDFFGDAVNVVSRLIEHTGQDETLITESVHAALQSPHRQTFRSLDRLAIRGRSEPVGVWVALRQDPADMPATHFGALSEDWPRPMSLLLSWARLERRFSSDQTPVLIGRDQQSTCHIEMPTVSRSHARIDWHSGGFQLTDLSFNGTFVLFAEGNGLSLRRGTCTLVGSGRIGLGAPASDPQAAYITFNVSGGSP